MSASRRWAATKKGVRRNERTGIYFLNKWVAGKTRNESTRTTDFEQAVAFAAKRTTELNERAKLAKAAGLHGDLTIEGASLLYQGIPVGEMLAYSAEIAARLVGRPVGSLRRAIARGELRETPNKVIPRSELVRFLEAALPALNG